MAAALLLALHFGAAAACVGGDNETHSYADLLDAVMLDVRSYVRLRCGAQPVFAMPTRWTAPGGAPWRVVVYLSTAPSKRHALARTLEVGTRRDRAMLLFETQRFARACQDFCFSATFAGSYQPPLQSYSRTMATLL